VVSEHGQCLTEETLSDYLEGSLDPAVRAVSEVHLITCDDCRLQLGYFMRLLGEEIGAEEESALQAISARWDKTKSERQLPRRTGTFRSWFLALVAVAAVLLIGVVSVYSVQQWNESKSASAVVQLLLAKQRPFESRLSDEPHLQTVRTRGIADSDIDYGLLTEEMMKRAAGMHEMGRFYLIQKEFDRASQYLEIAAGEKGAAAAVHNDLGVAYLEGGDPLKRDKAVLEFRQALVLDPAFRPAIFNLALFYERTNAAAEAAAEWKRYLELDPKSDWTAEARGRLEGLSR